MAKTEKQKDTGIRAELAQAGAEMDAGAQKLLNRLQNQPNDYGLSPFVSDEINFETLCDDSGTIDPDLLQFEAAGFPKVKNTGLYDGGRIREFLGTEEKDTSKEPALPRDEHEKQEGQRNIHEDRMPDLKKFNVSELIELLRRVKRMLPSTKLKDLDLEEELVLHFLNLKELMTDILYDEDVPANQKAQIANSCASLLQQMTKSQAMIYSAERVKRMEGALLKALHGLPQDILESFIDRYERIYDAEDL